MSEHERHDQDEPETGLDAQGRDRKDRLLQEMQGEGDGHTATPVSADSSPGGVEGSSSTLAREEPVGRGPKGPVSVEED